MSKQTSKVYEFDNFRLDAGERQLSRNGAPVTLPSKAFALLLALVENSGRLVEKEEIVIAVLHAALGERDQAFALLDKAYDERDTLCFCLKLSQCSIRCDQIRDSRFCCGASVFRNEFPRWVAQYTPARSPVFRRKVA